ILPGLGENPDVILPDLGENPDVICFALGANPDANNLFLYFPCANLYCINTVVFALLAFCN
ncbi:hypothetical protein, partial [Sulfurimonas sp.]|uniref:hypothetical protein n=1 Tax=Sulfurimonas sp. TaxID=2022749 RepID=UPI003D0CF345